jgi:hypothetical protein
MSVGIIIDPEPIMGGSSTPVDGYWQITGFDPPELNASLAATPQKQLWGQLTLNDGILTMTPGEGEQELIEVEMTGENEFQGVGPDGGKLIYQGDQLIGVGDPLGPDQIIITMYYTRIDAPPTAAPLQDEVVEPPEGNLPLEDDLVYPEDEDDDDVVVISTPTPTPPVVVKGKKKAGMADGMKYLYWLIVLVVIILFGAGLIKKMKMGGK